MRILFLNWRDIRNPKSGGAEILTHEIARRLVAQNHEVIQFSSYFPGSKKKEIVDGVTILREGDPDLRKLFFSVQFKAWINFKNGKFGKTDVVIDEVHGMPFFTPLYVNVKTFALICEYAGDLWDVAVKFPFNIFGKQLEKIYPMLYRNVPIITISDSSRKELGPHFRSNTISVISPGCNVPIIKKVPLKSKILTLIFIARIAESKGIEDLLRVVQELTNKTPDVNVHIIGRGEESYIRKLKQISVEKMIDEKITFHGFISEQKKLQLIDSSHILLATSRKEGWGLTVHEANSRGVPVVSYNVPGLRDVVKNGVNGFLCKKNTPQDMAKTILTIFNDKKLYNKLSQGSINQRKKYTWDRTADEFIKCIS